MTEYYKEKLEQGLEYQDFVVRILIQEIGLPLSMYNSRKYQWKYGENKQGIEIKFDDKYKKTGNLYIEVAEKSNGNNLEYIPSGILRNDNTWLYLIGNYSIIYIFAKRILIGLYHSGKYRKVEIPTSQGYLLSKEDAKKYVAKILEISDKEAHHQVV